MKNTKGSILVFALVILSFILIAAFSVAAVTLVERRSANISVNSSTAFQNADKGMEEFLQQIYKDLDQNDTLDDLKDKLNDVYGSGAYACVDGSSDTIPARIGDQNTEFIISAYTEGGSGATGSGWEVVRPIQFCDTALADVARFKVAGNYNTAVRAVFVKLRDSLTRGLVARWSFEDRAQNARVSSEDDDKTSLVAQDSSKQNHVLTLCRINADPSDLPIKVTVDVESGNELDLEEFGDCDGAGEGSGMIHKKQGECDECDEDGAWVEGIVEEEVGGGAFDDDSAVEALYFDGVDDYLMLNPDANCDNASTLNCTEIDEEKLNVKSGIAISLWVKPEVAGVSGHLVSRYDGSDGYDVYLDDGNVCFRLDNAQDCAGGDELDDTDWHHVVARWRKNTSDMEVFVDAVATDLSQTQGGDIGDTQGDDFMVGVDVETESNYFNGTIDDIRIWERALTDSEICRLCTEAAESGTNCNSSCS